MTKHTYIHIRATRNSAYFLGDESGARSGIPGSFAYINENAVTRREDDELAVALLYIKDANLKCARCPGGVP
jgi:hypothetical protein